MALVCLATAATPSWPVAAQSACSGASGDSSPVRRMNSQVDSWAVQAAGQRDCRGGVRVEVIAEQKLPGDIAPGAHIDHPLSSSGVLVVPIYCRRDDYM